MDEPTRQEWLERCKKEALTRIEQATSKEQVWQAWVLFAFAMRRKEYTADDAWLWIGDLLVDAGLLATVPDMRNFIEPFD